MRLLELLGAATLVLSSCSRIEPLTAEQRTQFFQVLESIGRVQSAVKVAQGDAPRDEISSRMAERLRGQSCQITLRAPDATTHSGFFINRPMDIQVLATPGCPIQLKMSSRLTGGPRSSHADLEVSYQVLETEFTKLIDVTFMQFNGSADLNGTQLPGQTRLEGTATVHGLVKSQKEGDVVVEITAQLREKTSLTSPLQNNERQSRLLSTFHFPHFVAKLKEEGKMEVGNWRTHYSLNEEELSPQEYRDIVERGGMLFQVMNGLEI